MINKKMRMAGIVLMSFLMLSLFALTTCSQDTGEQQSQQQTEQMDNQQDDMTQQESADEMQSDQEMTESGSMEDQGESTMESSEPQMEPLNIQLPPAMFVGTPTNMNVQNLEPASDEARPPFMAPEGTENVALDKPVTSSDPMPIIGELSMVTDGDKQAGDGHYVELGPFLKHVTIDLEGTYDIYAVVLWHYHQQARVYSDVIVQIADDPDFTENVTTIFNNDFDNSAGFGVGEDMHYIETNEGKLIDAGGVQGRYVRCYSAGNNSNDLNHYVEVAVYGRPTPAM